MIIQCLFKMCLELTMLTLTINYEFSDNFLFKFYFQNWIYTFTWSFSSWNLGSVKALQTSSLWKKLFLKPFFMKPRLFIDFIRFGRKIEYKISSCNKMSGGRKILQKGKRGIKTPHTLSQRYPHENLVGFYTHTLFSILHEFVNIKFHVPWL